MTGPQLLTSDRDQRAPGSDPLLEVRNLSVYLPGRRDEEVQILDDVSFSVDRGMTLGVIGESGSGKSMTALALLRLLPPGGRIEGQILLDGTDLTALPNKEMKNVRGRRISMIFQEPMTALDPVFTVGRQISQVLRAHHDVSRSAAREQSTAMLDAVGIPDPRRRFGEYPHQLSGGMRQRVMIAMALIAKPELLIADEPTTAVDITIQAQLLELLAELNSKSNTAIVLISHDIAVVSEVCEEVLVMYAGQVVESSTTNSLLERPRHPYASGLMWAVPRIEARGRDLYAIPGRVPLPSEVPDGCRFHPRCAHATSACVHNRQEVTQTTRDPHRHLVRCGREPDLELPGIHDRPPSLDATS